MEFASIQSNITGRDCGIPDNSPMTVQFTDGADTVHHLIIPYAATRSPMGPEALVRLQLPNMQLLLQTLTRVHTEEDDPDQLCLDMPHERALGQALQLPAVDGAWPWATLSEANPSGQAQAYFSPCHWQIGMDQVVMLNPDNLQLSEEESLSLLTAMQPFLTEDGLTVRYVAPTQWHVQGELLRDLRCASLDRVIGMNLNAWLPKSESAKSVRRLQSEMQMLLYNHPVNDKRSSQRQLTVNSFWVHGAGSLTEKSTQPAPQVTMALREHVLREDPSGWLNAWHALDATLGAALLEKTKTHAVTLTLCSEHAAHTYQTRPQKFWQRAQRMFSPVSAITALQAL
jgi:hypothetical protein